MPSMTITSAPALAASLTSSRVRGGADLDVDRDLPVGRLADLLDLEAQVGGPDEVGVAHRRALVDAERQVAHARHLVRHLGAQQHAAGAGLGALADDDLDRVGARHVVGVVAVVARADLVDQAVGVRALHAGACRRRRWWSTCPRGWRRARCRPWRCATARRSDMPQTVIGIFSRSGRSAKRVPSTVSVSQRSRYPSSGTRERVHGEERQVVEVRHPAASSTCRGSGSGRARP